LFAIHGRDFTVLKNAEPRVERIVILLTAIIEFAWVFSALFSVPGTVFIGAASVLAVGFILAITGRDLGQILRSLMCLSLPLSFRSITGGSYAESIVSWFNITAVALLLYELIRVTFVRKTSRLAFWSVIACLVCAMVASLSLALSRFPANGISNLVNLVVFLALVSLGAYETDEDFTAGNAFVIGALVNALALIIQYYLYRSGGITIGRIVVYPGRTGYGALFSDFSFLSLYFAAVGAYLLGSRIKGKYLLVAFLLLASILTSARTGAAAFAIIALIYVSRVFRFTWKTLLAYGSIVILAIVAFSVFAAVRGGENLLSFNGRLETYLAGWQNFTSSPWLGIGMGFENYGKSEHPSEFPHNTYLQMLAQTGILGFVSFLAVLALLWKRQRAANFGASLAFLCVLIGALFIPDIMNSRFLPVLVVIGMGSTIDATKAAKEQLA
jgi:O-antigen ligase